MLPERAASYAARREQARSDLERADLDALVVSHPPNVRYLTAFTGSAGVLLLAGGSAHLIVDSRYATAARAAVEAGSVAADELTVVVAPTSVDETLYETLRTSGPRRIGIESQSMSVARCNRLVAALARSASSDQGPPVTAPVVIPTERLVESRRLLKEPWEIATLREAGQRLAQVARQVPSLVRQGRSEMEVAAEIDFMIRAAGFERAAFETIVASGPNSALPHARPGARRLEDDEGVVLDFGGVYDGYSVDLTRTVELGRARPEWRRLVAAVSAAQRAAIAAVRPGVPASVVDAAARELLAEQGLGEAFAHATGHGLGLEVHEEPRIGRRIEGQADVVLEPGMVFTVEPGAYVEGLGGVRLEDDVLVTSGGCEVLTL
jgi:Xaa-Pro aminopeptidase